MCRTAPCHPGTAGNETQTWPRQAKDDGPGASPVVRGGRSVTRKGRLVKVVHVLGMSVKDILLQRSLEIVMIEAKGALQEGQNKGLPSKTPRNPQGVLHVKTRSMTSLAASLTPASILSMRNRISCPAGVQASSWTYPTSLQPAPLCESFAMIFMTQPYQLTVQVLTKMIQAVAVAPPTRLHTNYL